MWELQQTLHIQLVNRPLPEAAKTDPRLALGELKKASKDVSVLLVLDDVWKVSDVTPLNFVDGSSASSAVVVTTRIRSLMTGAAEVQCSKLSTEAALEQMASVEATAPAARVRVEVMEDVVDEILFVLR